MSDLYLDLKRKIPVVAEWTFVGSEEMQRAQDRIGLSDERLAREIPISAKTWVRWKRRGAIPTHLLTRVAPVLGFEMVPMEPVSIPVSAFDHPAVLVTPDLRESLVVMVDLLRAIAETSERVESALLRIEQATLARAPAKSRARRGA